MEIISHQMELMYDKVGTYLTLKNVSFSWTASIQTTWF
jgi:hypothetical protein